MSKDVDFEEQQQFLLMGVQKARDLGNSIDQQINILVGISSAIFLYSISQYVAYHELAHLSLTLFMGLAMLLSIITIHPFRWMRRRGQKESVFYNRFVVKQESPVEYGKILDAVVVNRDALINEYATEVYNLYKYYYRPKRDLYLQTRNVFSLGIVLTIAIVVIQMLFQF